MAELFRVALAQEPPIGKRYGKVIKIRIAPGNDSTGLFVAHVRFRGASGRLTFWSEGERQLGGRIGFSAVTSGNSLYSLAHQVLSDSTG